jgi:hypothetical protein
VTTLQGQAKDLEDVEDRIVDAEKLLQRSQQELEEVKTQIKKVDDKGFTPEILALALRIDVESTEFLKRLETRDEFNDLLVELQQERENLKKILIEETDTKTNIMRLRGQEKAIADEVRSQTNVLDDLQNRTRGYRDAVMVVRGFFSQRYSVTDLQSLRRGIDMLGIKGDPERSLQRVFETIKREGLLSGLNDSITSRRTELKILKEKIAEKHGELEAVFFAAKESSKAIPNMIDEAIKDIKTKAVNELEEVSDKSKIKLGDTQKIVNALANDFKRETKASLESVDVETRKILKNMEVETKKFLTNTDTGLTSTAVKFDKFFAGKQKEIENFGALKQLIGENLQKVKQTQLFYEMLEHPTKMLELDFTTIHRLSKGFEAYVNDKCANELIKESKSLVRDRHQKTGHMKRSYSENQQSFTFSKVVSWAMDYLREHLD